MLRAQIQHFFENYKDLEAGKWVKVEGWDNADAASRAIDRAIAAYNGGRSNDHAPEAACPLAASILSSPD